jgi:hypothetical protein
MKKIIPLVFVFFAPFIVYGQLSQIKNVNSLANRLAGIGNIITYLLVGLAVIYIIWNTVQYLIKPNSAERSEAVASIGWGILGLFIIVSLWGIVNILVNTFYTDPNVPRNRFPNADFVNNNSSNNSSSYPVNNVFNQDNGVDPEPDDIRDIPADESSLNTGRNIQNNWNTNLDPNSSDNTQNYNH